LTENVTPLVTGHGVANLAATAINDPAHPSFVANARAFHVATGQRLGTHGDAPATQRIGRHCRLRTAYVRPVLLLLLSHN
jgi:hypothetical protein